MHADELRMAVAKVVDILEKAEIRSVIDQYRSASSEQRTAAAARLGHAGAVLMERINSLSPAERQVTKLLHLDTLGTADYWRGLLGSVDDPKQHQAEIVRLASRVMFASNHLPGMIKLIGSVKNPEIPADSTSFVQPLEAGEGRIAIRLTDAGERASDPDRVARAIDGMDMLYSACASIARKPAIDLRMDKITARRNGDRDLQFTGERDSLSAVFAVIDSIPAALAEIDPGQDIDLDSIVQSLPVFEDLNTLASLGTFTKKDMKDISDTLHQGALLTLESGVILLDPEPAKQAASLASKSQRAKVSGLSKQVQANASSAPESRHTGSTPDEDDHYERYLREREAMLQAEPPVLNKQQRSSSNGSGSSIAGISDQARKDAVEELLNSLGQSQR